MYETSSYHADLHAMRTLARVSHGEALTLVVTFVATLTIRLEVAILVGVLVSGLWLVFSRNIFGCLALGMAAFSLVRLVQ